MKKRKYLSLNKKLILFSASVTVPFLILTVYLITSLSNFSNAYNRSVKNITDANAYNVSFKKSMDLSMYKIVIGSESFAGASESDRIEDPYELIDDIRTSFTEVYQNTTGKTNRKTAESLLKIIDRLENAVSNVEQNIEERTYKENMDYLENNTKILSASVQNQIQTYIYNEAVTFEEVRSGLENQVENAVRISIFSFIVILTGTIAAAAFITRSIARPIQDLCQVSDYAAKGDLSIRADITTSSEAAVLAGSFNHMLEEIGLLVENIKKEQRNLRSAELKLLQTQINPHFLYNTLDNIIWMVAGNQKEQAVSMVTSLSEFFRIVLSEGRDYITVQEEENHIRSYLEIQQFRYRDILDYEIAIDQEIYPFIILKLTLQPLIENALYHGIKNKRGRGRIRVTGEEKQGILYFTVSDNGIGMSEEKRLKLERKISGEEKDNSEGFGLANVDERLRMNFGQQYGISIESKAGEGTVVTVRIPAWTEMPEHPK